jgi:hypothetical protein
MELLHIVRHMPDIRTKKAAREISGHGEYAGRMC